jgi:two-component system chemotaxis sensor kinase CheA
MQRDPYRYFRVEARALLEQLGTGALELDKGLAAPDTVARMLRGAHTLKGAASVVKQREIVDHAHAIEDALSPFRETGDTVSRQGIDAALRALDEITLRMAGLAPQPQSESAAGMDSGSRIQRLPAENGSIELMEPNEPLGTNVDEMDALLDGLTEANVQLVALRRGIAPLKRSRRLAQLLEEQLAAPRGDRSNVASPKLAAMASELRGLVESVQRNVIDGVEQVERELNQSREAAERLRLLPASFMFVSLERAVRDAAQALGKRIAFVTSGGAVRLDVQVFGAIQSALVQAVRNAVAHGIESEVERATAGKPAEGRVSIDVRRRGHRAVIVCRDDGRGVDLDAVRRAMERKGVLPADAATLSTEELLRILLRGGITTSGAVTQLAGRGIGLDIIREAASRFRGEVSIRTDKGLGTSLEIIVPISLAVVDALIVESAGRVVAIPMDAVKRTLRVAIGDLAQSAQGASIEYEGKIIPFAPLERMLQRGTQSRNAARSWSAVVIAGADALAAVGIDRLYGTQNLVVRPLPDLTPSDLDAEALVEHVRRGVPAAAATSSPGAPILVIDDSLTTRMLEQSILESAGYEVELAVSGEDALERARKRRYALFLVDVEMPGMDGFTFIERTQADPVLREIPAILVTSRASPEDRRRGQSVGARAYIVKGEFDQTELLEKIRLLVGTQ